MCEYLCRFETRGISGKLQYNRYSFQILYPCVSILFYNFRRFYIHRIDSWVVNSYKRKNHVTNDVNQLTSLLNVVS